MTREADMKEPANYAQSFREVHLKFSRLFTRILSDRDLTLPQYALLNTLHSAGAIPMTEASEKLHISKPAVTNLVDRLEEGRYLARQPHPEDRRVNLLKILAKGEKVVAEVQKIVVFDLLVKTMDSFEDQEKESIAKFLKAISEQLSETIEGVQARG